jgi:heme exporter protein D
VWSLNEVSYSKFRRSSNAGHRCFVAWVTWAGSLLLPALISLVSYSVIQRPRLRRRAAEQRRLAASLRRQKYLMDLRVAATSPTGDEVLAAVRSRINKLGRVDVENAARL